MINLKALITLIEYNMVPTNERLIKLLSEQCRREGIPYTQSSTHYIFPVGDGLIHVSHLSGVLKVQITDVNPNELAEGFKNRPFISTQDTILIATAKGKILISDGLLKELKQYLKLED